MSEETETTPLPIARRPRVAMPVKPSNRKPTLIAASIVAASAVAFFLAAGVVVVSVVMNSQPKTLKQMEDKYLGAYMSEIESDLGHADHLVYDKQTGSAVVLKYNRIAVTPQGKPVTAIFYGSAGRCTDIRVNPR